MLSIPWIAADDDDTPFPDVERALDDPDGLLAMGGPLSTARLEQAYRAGVFPWFAEGQPVLWWAPSVRSIIRPGAMHLSRSLRKRLRAGREAVTVDRAFARVIAACAAPREGASGTWITDDMRQAYEALHDRGIAHSLEVWRQGELVGGLYGVSLGTAFFGESMFSRASDASKIALAWLAAQLRAWGFGLIDCQMPTPHLERLGAVRIGRRRFSHELSEALLVPTRVGPWRLSEGLDPLSAGGGS